nr:protein toll-like [Rhipicephalus microplus]
MCDCRLSWLMQRESAVHMLGNAVCSSPSWHKGKELFTIAEHDFARWDDDCSAGCLCECHEGPLGARDIHVNCASRRLTSVPTVLPQGTVLLDLRDNEISTLDDTLKAVAPELQFLSLKDNMLQNLNVTSIPVKLQDIDLSGNDFKRLPYSLLTERNLTAIWLSGNPFVCDCADYPLMRWIQVHVDVIKDIHDVVCADGSNPLIARKLFMSLGEKDLCPETVSRTTTYLLTVLGLVAVTLTLLSIYLRWKHNIRTWLDARGWGCLTRITSDDELDDDKLFDVFISFSSKDQDFIHDNILPIMDTHGFAYCTYERNFKGGFLLQDIIHDAVACSRRTLLVLTQNFVESEWCRWEFRVAHRRALQDKVNRLIVVLVDECASGSLDEDLRAYVRVTNYLRWNEKNLRERLLASMPRKDTTRKTIVEERHVGSAAGDNEGAQPL